MGPPGNIWRVAGGAAGPREPPLLAGAWHDRRVIRTSRQRLDQLLVERGLVESRTRAQALVLAGKVGVGEGDAARHDRKPGDLLDATVPVEVVEKDPYVSRGAHKLIAALDAFGIDPAGLTALDVGASTGGFTDVLLQRGARRVYALDVGRGQLADPLRPDPRVVSMERTNARTLAAGVLPEPIELAVIDVAFISLGLVLGPVVACFGPRAAGSWRWSSPSSRPAGRTCPAASCATRPSTWPSWSGSSNRPGPSGWAWPARSPRRSWARRATASSCSTCASARPTTPALDGARDPDLADRLRAVVFE